MATNGALGRKLRMGLVGGGQGSFIGRVHMTAAVLDNRATLVAGAFSSDPERARASAADYAAAEADPIRPYAAGAIEHLNADHAPALIEMARALGGFPDARVAECTGVDRYGLELKVDTPRGQAYTRVGFGGALSSFDQLRAAAADLVHRARAAENPPGRS